MGSGSANEVAKSANRARARLYIAVRMTSKSLLIDRLIETFLFMNG